MRRMLIHPDIDPVALQLGPIAVHWYGLTYLAAFGLFMLLGRLRLRHQRQRQRHGCSQRPLFDTTGCHHIEPHCLVLPGSAPSPGVSVRRAEVLDSAPAPPAADGERVGNNREMVLAGPDCGNPRRCHPRHRGLHYAPLIHRQQAR